MKRLLLATALAALIMLPAAAAAAEGQMIGTVVSGNPIVIEDGVWGRIVISDDEIKIKSPRKIVIEDDTWGKIIIEEDADGEQVVSVQTEEARRAFEAGEIRIDLTDETEYEYVRSTDENEESLVDPVLPGPDSDGNDRVFWNGRRYSPSWVYGRRWLVRPGTFWGGYSSTTYRPYYNYCPEPPFSTGQVAFIAWLSWKYNLPLPSSWNGMYDLYRQAPYWNIRDHHGRDYWAGQWPYITGRSYYYPTLRIRPSDRRHDSRYKKYHRKDRSRSDRVKRSSRSVRYDRDRRPPRTATGTLQGWNDDDRRRTHRTSRRTRTYDRSTRKHDTHATRRYDSDRRSTRKQDSRTRRYTRDTRRTETTRRVSPRRTHGSTIQRDGKRPVSRSHRITTDRKPRRSSVRRTHERTRPERRTHDTRKSTRHSVRRSPSRDDDRDRRSHRRHRR